MGALPRPLREVGVASAPSLRDSLKRRDGTCDIVEKMLNATCPGQSIRTKFNWVSTGSFPLNTTFSGNDEIILFVNALQSPTNVNSTQPSGVQEWKKFYNSFKVQTATIKATFTPTGNTPLIVGIVAYPYQIDGPIDFKFFKSETWPHVEKLLTAQNGGNDTTHLELHVNIADIVGNYDQYNADLIYSASFNNGNPLVKVHSYVYVSTIDDQPSGLPTDVTFVDLSIEFDAILYQPKLLNNT